MGVEQWGNNTKNDSQLIKSCCPQIQTSTPQLTLKILKSQNQVILRIPTPESPHIVQLKEVNQIFVPHSVQKTSGLFNEDLFMFSPTKTLNPTELLDLTIGELAPNMESESITDLALDGFFDIYTDLSDLVFEDQQETALSTEKPSNLIASPDVTSNLSLDLSSLIPLDFKDDFEPLEFSTNNREEHTQDKISLVMPTTDVKSPIVLEAGACGFNKGEKITKYYERRAKNNVASQLSRKNRKRKEKEMEEQLIILEKDNKRLKEEVELLEGLTQRLKGYLVQKLSEKQ